MKKYDLSLKKKYIWGAGNIGQRAYYVLKDNGIKIDGFIDREKKSIETIGATVYSPQEIMVGDKDAFIYVAMEQYEDLEKELVSKGLIFGKDYVVLCKSKELNLLDKYVDDCCNRVETKSESIHSVNVSIGCCSNILVGENVKIGEGTVFVCDGFSQVIIGDNVSIQENCRIVCTRNSRLIIEKDSVIRRFSNISVISDSLMLLGEQTVIGENNSLYVARKSRMTVGKLTDFDKNTDTRILNESVCEIGEDCMFSYDISIRGEDGHPIYDIESGDRINISKNVKILNHVWIGMRTTILGGTNIGENCVVGACSLVKNSFDSNLVIAGIPARKIRKDVCWSREYND
jgi:acetyltransferase-like isoleucine patch superfamily enzyme